MSESKFWEAFKAAEVLNQVGEKAACLIARGMIEGLAPHEVLGVTPTAEMNHARQAYLRLIKEWHPDRHQGAQALANEITAYINQAWLKFQANSDVRTDAGMVVTSAGAIEVDLSEVAGRDFERFVELAIAVGNATFCRVLLKARQRHVIFVGSPQSRAELAAKVIFWLARLLDRMEYQAYRAQFPTVDSVFDPNTYAKAPRQLVNWFGEWANVPRRWADGRAVDPRAFRQAANPRVMASVVKRQPHRRSYLAGAVHAINERLRALSLIANGETALVQLNTEAVTHFVNTTYPNVKSSFFKDIRVNSDVYVRGLSDGANVSLSEQLQIQDDRRTQ
jgi:hypothetical protein